MEATRRSPPQREATQAKPDLLKKRLVLKGSCPFLKWQQQRIFRLSGGAGKYNGRPWCNSTDELSTKKEGYSREVLLVFTIGNAAFSNIRKS